MGIQICMQNKKIFFDPCAPPSSPPTLAAGTGASKGICFSKPPHICVQNDQCNEGIILRYVCWGTWDPSLATPPPPHDPPALWFTNWQCLTVNVTVTVTVTVTFTLTVRDVFICAFR